ncbi:hypothetical protein MKK69_24945 [Methylobacterium sp. J-026]|uniref:hypothetical protein n=1 Tax=Methylobacterium sp. J-026 TaxID=2836624 RepID=UPI001FBA7888|nr:hypothetical protein [Methylobacterium sp. J-026]MCJ2137252.1 hypothetical protein [Methylobacterium sp. J-026]
MSATRPARTPALALGLVLPLAFAGAAAAQQGTAPRAAWVDPPPRAAAPAPGAAQGPAQEPAREPMKAAANPPDSGRAPVKAQTEGPVRQAATPEPSEDALPKAAATRVPGPRRAAALERPPVRETLRRHAGHPHRLAETPAAFAPAPGASAERAAAARALTASYLATVSGSNDTMVGAATQFYATRVRFYGRPVTTAALVAEKRSFVQRWPERRYEPRAMRTACDAETCTIRTLVAFRTANPGRGAVSSGEAELILEVGFAGTRPYILGETGRVLRRSIQAGSLAASPGKA